MSTSALSCGEKLQSCRDCGLCIFPRQALEGKGGYRFESTAGWATGGRGLIKAIEGCNDYQVISLAPTIFLIGASDSRRPSPRNLCCRLTQMFWD